MYYNDTHVVCCRLNVDYGQAGVQQLAIYAGEYAPCVQFM